MHEEEQWLNNGWAWLDANEGDSRYIHMEEVWLDRLQKYEQAYRQVFCGEQDAQREEQDRAAD